MSYPSGSGYYPADQSGGYDGYSQWSPEVAETGPKTSYRQLTLAVVGLGLGSYLCSFGPMLSGYGIDWDVRFAVLAGLLAAFGLLPQQTPAAKIVAALAAIGFLDALSRVVVVPDGVEPGWAMWVVVVLNALQTGVAIGALLTQPSLSAEQQAWYAAYAEQYAQAAAQYYDQYAQEQPEQPVHEAATAQAQQTQQVSAPEPRRAAAPQEASYAEFVGEPAPAAQASAPTTAQPPAGLPSVGHTATPAQQQSVSEPEYRTSN